MELKELLKDVVAEDNIETVVETLNKEIAKSYMPRNKFNEVNEELKATKTQLESMNTKIEELSKNSTVTDELKKQLEEANSKYQEFEKQATTREQNLAKKYAIEKSLRNANANPDTIDLLVDKFNLDAIQLDSKGTIVDWENHLTPIKEERKSLFGEPVKQGTELPKGNSNGVDLNTLSDTDYLKAKLQQ